MPDQATPINPTTNDQQQNTSYVDTYSTQIADANSQVGQDNQNNQNFSDFKDVSVKSDDDSVNNNQEPVADMSSAPAPTAADDKERLEDQNIFELLGVKFGNDEEKESFLDELQQVIWEDFVQHDVELLITTEEMEKVKHIATEEGTPDADRQEKLVSYLEELVPDLEDIMLEKALELKEEMFKERVSAFRDVFKAQQDKLDQVERAEDLMSQDKWSSAAKILNSLAS